MKEQSTMNQAVILDIIMSLTEPDDEMLRELGETREGFNGKRGAARRRCGIIADNLRNLKLGNCLESEEVIYQFYDRAMEMRMAN